MTIAQRRVARGAALLDQQKPGWHTMVDISGLDMGNAYCCVLGQAYMSYNRGRGLLFRRMAEEKLPSDFHYRIPDLVEQNAIEHGFNDDEKVGHNELFEAWLEAILDRRKVAAPIKEEELVLA